MSNDHLKEALEKGQQSLKELSHNLHHYFASLASHAMQTAPLPPGDRGTILDQEVDRVLDSVNQALKEMDPQPFEIVVQMAIVNMAIASIHQTLSQFEESMKIKLDS